MELKARLQRALQILEDAERVEVLSDIERDILLTELRETYAELKFGKTENGELKTENEEVAEEQVVEPTEESVAELPIAPIAPITPTEEEQDEEQEETEPEVEVELIFNEEEDEETENGERKTENGELKAENEELKAENEELKAENEEVAEEQVVEPTEESVAELPVAPIAPITPTEEEHDEEQEETEPEIEVELIFNEEEDEETENGKRKTENEELKAENEEVAESSEKIEESSEEIVAVAETPITPITPTEKSEEIEDNLSTLNSQLSTPKRSALLSLYEDASTPVLGEQFHESPSVADTIACPKGVAESAPVASLREAIGLADKFMLIRELFDGNAEEYDNAIAALDKQPSFDDCIIYISENYTWSPSSAATKLVMELLERKYN